VFGGWGATAEDNGVQGAIKNFEQQNPQIAVKWQLTPQAPDYMTQLLTNFAAKTAPDASFITSDSYETLASQGLLTDLTDRIKADQVLGQKGYFFEPQEAARCADDKGRWHGIGACWVATQFYYNADLLAKENIPAPGFKDAELWDWDMFITYAKQLTVDNKGRHPDDSGFDPDNIERWGVAWPMDNWVTIATAVYANGGTWIKDGKITLDSPEAIEALQRLYELVYVHHVAPRAAAMTSLGMTNTQMIDSGKLAIAVDGSWALSWMNPSTVKNVKMGTSAVPKMKQAATFMQAHFHSVISSSQHPDEAWQWVRFLATPFYQTEFLKIGLWLPSQTALTTPDALKTWITQGIHPDNYSEFVTDYLPKYGVTTRIPPGYIEASSTYITPMMEAIADGTPADKAVTKDGIQKANDILAKAQKS
jgi:multiple sugar transport system substrate-binding protein